MSLRNACERDFQEQERVTGNDCRHFFFIHHLLKLGYNCVFPPGRHLLAQWKVTQEL